MPRMIHLQLHLLVLLYATTAIFGHLITLSSSALVVWRTAMAAVGGAALVIFILRRRLMPPPGVIPMLLGIGCLAGLHWMCFFGAIKLANISICLAGLATSTFFTAFTEPLIEKRPVRPFEVALGVLVVCGIVLVAGFERGRLTGLLVALLSALLAAIFPVLNRRLVREHKMSPQVMLVWEMIGACAVCLVLLPVFDGLGGYRRLFDWNGLDFLWILILAFACTIFAHAFHIHLLRHLSAYTSNLAVNFEPVYGILAAAWLFGEHHQLHPGFYLGTLTILAANLLHPLGLRWLARRHRDG